MRILRTLAAGTAVWTAAWLVAAGQTETGLYAFGTNTYSAGILDEPRERTEARCPELFRPPAVGDGLAYRVFHGKKLQRELTATVIATNLLECADGPEIAIHPGQLRLDLLRALFLTDALHQTPQILEAPPAAPVFKPDFMRLDPKPLE